MKTRDERGRFASPEAAQCTAPCIEKEEVPSYGYYSKILNKPFNTLEELRAAEKEHTEKEELERKKLETKKERAKEVEAALKHVYDVRKDCRARLDALNKECSAEIAKAESEYNKLLTEFIKDYKYFHMSYSNDGIKEIVSVSDVIDSFFRNFGF